MNNKFKMDVIESGILSGQKDWQRISENGALPEGNWVKHREKLARQVDGKRDGGTRKYRRS